MYILVRCWLSLVPLPSSSQHVCATHTRIVLNLNIVYTEITPTHTIYILSFNVTMPVCIDVFLAVCNFSFTYEEINDVFNDLLVLNPTAHCCLTNSIAGRKKYNAFKLTKG